MQREEGEGDNDGGEVDKIDQNGTVADDKLAKPKEVTRDAKPKPAETGAWRRPSGGPKPSRNDAPRGPRGDGPARGPRNDNTRAPRSNGGAQAAASPVQASSVDSETATPEEDGWSTVSKPKKNQRGGSQTARAVVS